MNPVGNEAGYDCSSESLFTKPFNEIEDVIVIHENKGGGGDTAGEEDHVAIVKHGSQESGVVIDASVLKNRKGAKGKRGKKLYECGDGIPNDGSIESGQNDYNNMENAAHANENNNFEAETNQYSDPDQDQYNADDESPQSQERYNNTDQSQCNDASQNQFNAAGQNRYNQGGPNQYPGSVQSQYSNAGQSPYNNASQSPYHDAGQNDYNRASGQTSSGRFNDMTANRNETRNYSQNFNIGTAAGSSSGRRRTSKNIGEDTMQSRLGKQYEQLNNCQHPDYSNEYQPNHPHMDPAGYVEDLPSYGQMWHPSDHNPSFVNPGFPAAAEPMPLHYPQPMIGNNPYQQHYTAENGVLTQRMNNFGAAEFSRNNQNMFFQNVYHMPSNDGGMRFDFMDGSNNSSNLMMPQNLQTSVPPGYRVISPTTGSAYQSETSERREELKSVEEKDYTLDANDKELLEKIKEKKKNRIKRPMNAFLVWSSNMRKILAEKHPGMNNADISVKLGELWRAMTVEQKQPFYDQAAKIKEKHKKDNPDWVYQPKPKKRRLGQGTTWVYAITENPRGGRYINYINTYNNYDGNMSLGNMMVGSGGRPSVSPAPAMAHQMPQMPPHPMQSAPPPSLYLNQPSTSAAGSNMDQMEPTELTSSSPPVSVDSPAEPLCAPEPLCATEQEAPATPVSITA